MSTILSATFDQIADGLAESGFAIAENFLTPGEIDSILQLDEFRNGLLQFKKAGIGKHSERQINEAIRGDFIQWIDKEKAPDSVNVYLNKLQGLIASLNRNLFLSLKDYEVHMTRYPAGSHYKRHLDQFKADDHRKLSVILYLNKDWKQEQGGQLRMYLPAGAKDILPQAGSFVCFRSDTVEHEVLPASRDRLSLTGWVLDQLAELRHL
jgi:SM-20-related protein